MSHRLSSRQNFSDVSAMREIHLLACHSVIIHNHTSVDLVSHRLSSRQNFLNGLREIHLLVDEFVILLLYTMYNHISVKRRVVTQTELPPELEILKSPRYCQIIQSNMRVRRLSRRCNCRLVCRVIE